MTAPTIHRGVVPPDLVNYALRLIWRDLTRRGWLPDEIDNYRGTSDWFPWLKLAPEILDLRPRALVRGAVGRTPCDPQIVFQPPDELDGPLRPHVDRDERGAPYKAIAAVALTEQTPSNGGLVWWSALDEPIPVDPLRAGDVLELPPDTPHASTANQTGTPRVAVYFRWR